MRAIFVAVGVLYGVHFAFAAGKAKSPSAKASSIAKPAAVVAPPRAPQEVEREGVKLMDQVSVEGKTLMLNGRLALRKVTKFGIPVKVYVGALYTENKNSDSAALVANDEVKRLTMHYVRTIDRQDLVDAFREAYEATCQYNCTKVGEQFKPFAAAIVSIRKDNEIVLTFYKDKIEVETNGPNAKKATINDGDLSRNMLAVYISPKTIAGEDFRKDWLGL